MAIDNISETWYNAPIDFFIDKKTFEYRSYSHWAITELKNHIKKNKNKRIFDSIESFIRKMDDYSCIGNKSQNNWIFSIAKDVATHVEDILIFNRIISAT